MRYDDDAFGSPETKPSQAKPKSPLGEWDAGAADYTDIPPRGWLLGNTFCRGFVSGLISEGAGGKTALRIAQCLALATGRPLTGEHIFLRGRVLLLVLEDGRDEIMRRLWAAMLHHRIEPAELKGWLFIATAESFTEKLATMVNGAVETGPLKAHIEEAVTRRRIDLVVIDPLKKAHAVPENDNGAMDHVIALLVDIAIKQDCAVDAPYHATKGPADPGNVNRGRGASSYKDGGRLIYTMSPMSPEDAEKFGLDDEDRRLIRRVDDAKVNLAKPGEAAWFELVDVPLGNCSDTYPRGDHVQTVQRWEPPDLWRGISPELACTILAEIDRGTQDGRPYSNHPNAKSRAAWPVVVRHLPDRTEQQARMIVDQWVRNDALRMVPGLLDAKERREVEGLKLNPANQPGNRWS
jgi:hypothetical protein